jgi:hypothetical protein
MFFDEVGSYLITVVDGIGNKAFNEKTAIIASLLTLIALLIAFGFAKEFKMNLV